MGREGRFTITDLNEDEVEDPNNPGEMIGLGDLLNSKKTDNPDNFQMWEPADTNKQGSIDAAIKEELKTGPAHIEVVPRRLVEENYPDDVDEFEKSLDRYLKRRGKSI